LAIPIHCVPELQEQSLIMFQLINTNLDSFFEKSLSVYTVYIPLSQDITYFMSIDTSTINRELITYFTLFLEFNGSAFPFGDNIN